MEGLYTGFVWTGNKLGAGTDARVSCWLEDVNKKNCGAPFIFRQKEGKILQKGSMNEITFRGDREKLSLADLKTMTIWHDGQGFMADWVLERICLTDCKTGKKFDFVFCEEYKFDKIKKNNRYFTIANDFDIYNIHVKTSDKLYSGTDNDIYITLSGEKDGRKKNTGEFLLDKSGRNDFERNQVDDFRVPATALDTIDEIKIHKKKASTQLSHDDWHLEWIKIEREDRPAITFQYKDWVKKDPIFLK